MAKGISLRWFSIASNTNGTTLFDALNLNFMGRTGSCSTTIVEERSLGQLFLASDSITAYHVAKTSGSKPVLASSIMDMNLLRT